ncbi:P1 family peptidase [Cognatishimia sp. SS12]|uniref:P1 family peptidase n=1 Tax=Cognatishimia sp. SS12 TaxID=2979465 RepID=UPI00232E695E|nr:P1 family peptidase [Cognatishimia sp. SS12]MDC0738475.1 P1 family peptidase [Cognatishimia sp. SS12]
MQTGPLNLITDITGLSVGNAENAKVKSGTTVLTAPDAFTAAVHVMGGAPGTRETDLLAPDKTVQKVNALVLSGGSAFGLDAASGVADLLRQQGRGFAVADQIVPIVPAAILFDLTNGGDKSWQRSPYYDLGQQALTQAKTHFSLGSAGAGFGATTASLKGGLGSASVITPSGHRVGALVAVNALGDAIVGETPHFWAAAHEINAEFGGFGPAPSAPPDWPATKFGGQNTTIAIVATDADLTQAECTRLATAAHDGMARALMPSHTPMDGDLVFAASTNAKPLKDPVLDPIYLGHAAATCLARAIARGVYCATPAPGDSLPTYQTRFGDLSQN